MVWFRRAVTLETRRLVRLASVLPADIKHKTHTVFTHTRLQYYNTNKLGIAVYSEHAIAAYFAYFAKMRISHVSRK